MTSVAGFDTLGIEAGAPARLLPVSLSRAAAPLVLVAITFAALSQGAYYWEQLRLTALLVFAGVALSIAVLGFTWRDVGAPVIAAGVLAGWYVVAGLHADNVAGAAPAALLLATLAATVVVVRRADARERELALVSLLGVGVLLALTGWAGVAWRQSPRALEDGGLWRAASTITYANGTGCVLAALALLALSGFLFERKVRTVALVTYVLLVGLLATASRAAFISFAVGLVVLIVWSKGRVLSRNATVIAGAFVACMSLLPSMAAQSRPAPGLAMIGLAVGALISVVPRRLLVFVFVAMGLALMSTAGIRHSVGNAFDAVQRSRATASSPDRARELHAGLGVARAHPLTGVGPGKVDLTWGVFYYVPVTMHVSYAHNEYLQTLDEAGGIGLLILVGGVVATGAAMWRARRDEHVVATAGCVSALLALAIHSSMDFLWHIPLIALVGAVLVGSQLTRPERPDSSAAGTKEQA